MLHVKNLTAGYADIIAVRDFSFSASAGKITALMGANGAGKTSTIMCVFGLVSRKSGSIELGDENITHLKTEDRISKGFSIVPEGRRIFPDLTVKENLMVGGHILPTTQLLDGIEVVYNSFPRLGERRTQLAGSLSGGEQQMLAIGRALITQPRIIFIDEISLGLMPKIVDECYAVLQNLKDQGIAIVLVEQNSERVLEAADDIYILEAGNMVWSGSAELARNSKSIVNSLMGA